MAQAALGVLDCSATGSLLSSTEHSLFKHEGRGGVVMLRFVRGGFLVVGMIFVCQNIEKVLNLGISEIMIMCIILIERIAYIRGEENRVGRGIVVRKSDPKWEMWNIFIVFMFFDPFGVLFRAQIVMV